MSQKTDLRPLSPSRSDLLSSWARPWMGIASAVWKTAPVLAVVVVMLASAFFDAGVFHSEAFEPVAEAATLPFETMFAVTQTVLASDVLMVLMPLPLLYVVMKMMTVGPRP